MIWLGIGIGAVVTAVVGIGLFIYLFKDVYQ